MGGRINLILIWSAWARKYPTESNLGGGRALRFNRSTQGESEEKAPLVGAPLIITETAMTALLLALA